MANSRKRCTGCKHYFPSEQMIKSPAGLFHDRECQIEYATNNVKKLAAKGRELKSKEAKRKKREYYQQDVKWQHKQTQIVFNKMRVMQEKLHYLRQGLEPICISCSKPLGGDQWCCGHFKTVGAQGRLRYDPKNTHLQHNHYCNMNLSGDIAGTKNTHGYKEGLLLRYGEKEGREVIDYCESNQSPYKWTCEELEQLRKECNAEIRKLAIELTTYEG